MDHLAAHQWRHAFLSDAVPRMNQHIRSRLLRLLHH
jgi:hypothetical protein